MTTFALTLVLLSALAHAGWNLLLKRSRDTLSFSWALAAVSAVVYAPVAAWRLGEAGLPLAGVPYLVGTVVLHVLYFWALGRAYAAGDLSLVYPLARGAGPLLVPVLAVLLLGEEVSGRAALGVALVVLGIYALHLRGLGAGAWLEPFRGLGARASRYAALTGVTIAVYSLWDKRGVALVDPLLYAYVLYAGCAIGLWPLAARGRLPAVAAEWRRHRVAVLAAGMLSPLAYGLVLVALTTSPVSYIVPLREVGIVVGAALGTALLGEPYGRNRVAGSAIVAAGVILIALG